MVLMMLSPMSKLNLIAFCRFACRISFPAPCDGLESGTSISHVQQGVRDRAWSPLVEQLQNMRGPEA